MLMKRMMLLMALAFFATGVYAQGYKVGDLASDFKLKNVNDKPVSLKDFSSAKGFIVIFTCNHCPYSRAYEDRIIALNKNYAAKGYPVIAINPNDPKVQPEDSFEKMKTRAKDKQFNFPYLVDETQQVTKQYGATRTPHVFVLQKTSEGYRVEYIGAIDDNTENGDQAANKYVQNAVDALLKDAKPNPSFTKALGCTIKWKKDS